VRDRVRVRVRVKGWAIFVLSKLSCSGAF